MALRSSDASTVQWAFFRLADIELGRANAGAALEWLVRAFNNFPAFPKAFDESYFPFGMLIEKPSQRCEAIEVLNKGAAAGSSTSKLFLADALRRQGDLRGALEIVDSLQTSMESSTRWMGDTIRQKLSLVDAKLKPQSLSSLNLADVWGQLQQESGKEFLKFDLVELAEIAGDEKLLTNLNSGILFPRYQPKVVSSKC
jgi:hypothetical protein